MSGVKPTLGMSKGAIAQFWLDQNCMSAEEIMVPRQEVGRT